MGDEQGFRAVATAKPGREDAMAVLGCRSRSVRAVLATVSTTVLAVAVVVAVPGRPAGAAPPATDQRAGERAGERTGERAGQPRAACTGDVFRLCGTEAPRVDQIIACLRKSRSVLSPACKAVVDPKG